VVSVLNDIKLLNCQRDARRCGGRDGVGTKCISSIQPVSKKYIF